MYLYIYTDIYIDIDIDTVIIHTHSNHSHTHGNHSELPSDVVHTHANRRKPIHFVIVVELVWSPTAKCLLAFQYSLEKKKKKKIQRNQRRPVPVTVAGVRNNSLLSMCTLNTLT